MKDNATELSVSLPFAEYGKIFRPEGKATDFERLDRSDEGTSTRLANFYNQKLAIYTVTNNLPFTSRAPGYGAVTAALMRDLDGTTNHLFIQIQQRREADPLLKKGIPLPNDVTNRPFNQARFNVIPRDQLQRAFQQRKALYTSLLARAEGIPQLRNCTESDLPRVMRHSIDYQPTSLDGLDPNYVTGLVNLLYKFFGPPAHSTTTGRSPSAVVLVMPDLDMEYKLRLMQEAQSILMPVTGVITFTLDYISEHLFSFYFCPEEPPSWMFTNPRLFYERDLRTYGQDLDGYYQVVSNLERNQLYSPAFIAYLGKKDIPIRDAVSIATLLSSEKVPPPDNLPELILRNVRPLRKDDVPILVNRAFEVRQMVERLLAAPEAPLALHRVILTQAQEHVDKDLVRYFRYHQQVKGIERYAPDLRDLFKPIIQANSSASLDAATPIEQQELFHELIILGYNEQLTFNDGTPVVEAILKRPGPGLNRALKDLAQQKDWIDRLTIDIRDMVIRFPGIWTDETVHALEEETGIKLPDTFVPRVTQLLSQLDKLESLHPDQRRLMLRNLLNPVGEAGKLLNLFQQNEETRNRLIQTCNASCGPDSLEGLRFTGWWLVELAGAREVVFKPDYLELVERFRSANPLQLETPDDQNINFILCGKANGLSNSLLDACRAAKLEEQYDAILRTWLGRLAIPTADIALLVEKLHDSNNMHDSNNILVEIVTKHTFDDQVNEIRGLSSENALDWLRFSAQNNLRQAYYDQAGEDQLYLRLCEILIPKPEFALYAIAEDPSACQVNLSWPDYIKKISSLYENFKNRGGGEGQAGTFVEMVKLFDGPPANVKKDYLHRYGLRRLAERSEVKDQFEAPLTNRELRLFLTYALDNTMDKKVRDIAIKILVAHRNRFLLQLSSLKDDEVYSLHLFYERNGLEKDSFSALTDDGWRRSGRTPAAGNMSKASPPPIPPPQDRDLSSISKPVDWGNANPVQNQQSRPNSPYSWLYRTIIIAICIMIIFVILIFSNSFLTNH